ncbi:MAG TPA: sigma 54-interacting transcriptional regulator, partial [Candidatus Polarisedimenticolia bacterium]|nr:sigma 54-interacting transcriptional regulator [Candidatus Polarisedimenticolia bacterium]
DLGSRNGTFVDGQRIETAVARNGSRVRAGRTTLALSGGLQAQPAAESGLQGLAEMAGRSAAMEKVYARIREAAVSRLPVLVLGETGTGKELAARAIHALGPRAGGPFVPINCAAVPKEMLEDELFGHAAGAFTGAAGVRRGVFEAADGGTIFLDEIAEIPPDLQSKLLRVVEDGHIPHVGGGGSRSDFRVLAATNQDIGQALANGRFRRDLYFRLSAVQILLPPLSDRSEDLTDLVHLFLTTAELLTGVSGSSGTRVEEAAFIPLREHSWPGNVRELRNLILRAVIRRPGGVIDRDLIEELLAETTLRGQESEPAPQSLEAVEREAIRNALRDCNGQRRAAARRLGIAESTLYEKIRRYGLGGEGGRS